MDSFESLGTLGFERLDFASKPLDFRLFTSEFEFKVITLILASSFAA